MSDTGGYVQAEHNISDSVQKILIKDSVNMGGVDDGSHLITVLITLTQEISRLNGNIEHVRGTMEGVVSQTDSLQAAVDTLKQEGCTLGQQRDTAIKNLADTSAKAIEALTKEIEEIKTKDIPKLEDKIDGVNIIFTKAKVATALIIGAVIGVDILVDVGKKVIANLLQ